MFETLPCRSVRPGNGEMRAHAHALQSIRQRGHKKMVLVRFKPCDVNNNRPVHRQTKLPPRFHSVRQRAISARINTIADNKTGFSRQVGVVGKSVEAGLRWSENNVAVIADPAAHRVPIERTKRPAFFHIAYGVEVGDALFHARKCRQPQIQAAQKIVVAMHHVVRSAIAQDPSEISCIPPRAVGVCAV